MSDKFKNNPFEALKNFGSGNLTNADQHVKLNTTGAQVPTEKKAVVDQESKEISVNAKQALINAIKSGNLDLAFEAMNQLDLELTGSRLGEGAELSSNRDDLAQLMQRLSEGRGGYMKLYLADGGHSRIFIAGDGQGGVELSLGDSSTDAVKKK